MSLSSPTMKPRPNTSEERSKKDRQGAVTGRSGVIEELETVERIAEVEMIVEVEGIEAMVSPEVHEVAMCEGEEEDISTRPK